MTRTRPLSLRFKRDKSFCSHRERSPPHYTSLDSATGTARHCKITTEDATAIIADNLPQPDFVTAAQHLTNHATEIGRVANVPAFQQGNQILDALNNLTDRITAMSTQVADMKPRLTDHLNGMDNRLGGLQQRVTAGFVRLEGRINEVSPRLDASNHSVLAIMNNTSIIDGSAALHPFHNANTNQPIPSFPANADAFQNLTVPDLDIIFWALSACRSPQQA
ncbi:hypothetical protein T440DRAFT_473120 [Plenodomus tracheiphilus IPT5]|uniref:Uncharacterized protein n=1 Tax=Plenodomus tracheiphilus IPT5 TaxID=1408161 RepID=A0A6A7AR19_9PLEO|nr:hypothetical protein T440DRAFT_473120 [Plenodomus tracheiphilus IPT5]